MPIETTTAGKGGKPFRAGGPIRTILVYLLTLGGILALPFLFVLTKSWVAGMWLLLLVVPLFPAFQLIISGREPAGLMVFLRVYAAEFCSLVLQLGFLLTTMPFIAIAIAGYLAMAMLAAAVISWGIIALQQVGLSIGGRMAPQDMRILLWVTLGLIAAVAVYFLLKRLAERHQDSYFSLWARQFHSIRDFFHHDIP